jgi:hypothetical protein
MEATMAKFTIELIKDMEGYSWSNTYHVEAAGIIPAQTAGAELLNFEQALSWENVDFIRMKVSPWPNPSNQGFLISVYDDQPGTRIMNNPEPAAMCLFASINAGSGHPGRKWYRFCLDESEVQQAAGKPIIGVAAPIRTAFDTAATALKTALDSQDVQLLIGSVPATARTSANDLVLVGCGLRDMDVGWYNKATTP